MRAAPSVGLDSPVSFDPDVRQYKEVRAVRVNGTGPWYPWLSLEDGMA
jgi:hypothetical protein